MTNEQEKQLTQLQRAHTDGYLDAKTYADAVAALTKSQSTAQVEAVARGAAIGGNVSDSEITTGDQNLRAGGHAIHAEPGATVVIGSTEELPVTMTASLRKQRIIRRQGTGKMAIFQRLWKAIP